MQFHLRPAYAWLLLLAAHASAANAASVVSVAPATPHPTQTVTVSGTGFGASEAIDIYVDTTDEMLLVTSAAGAFTATLSVPSGAQPGKHYATAIGRHSGDAAQYGFTVSTPWQQLGYGRAHYDQNPYENTLNTGNVNTLGPLWGTSTGAILGAPMVLAGKVFTAGKGISALSATTGAVLWNVDATDTFYGTPAVANGLVYVGSTTTDNLYAVATGTGAKKWTAVLGSTTRSSPVVADGVLYIGCNDDKLYAVNAATGAIKWTYTTGGTVASSPAIVDGIVYVGSLDASLYAIDAATGTLIWSFATNGAIYSSPVVANGVVYFGSYDNNLYAVAAGPRGGNLKWSATTSNVIYAGPTVVANKVIVGSEDGYEYAYNLRTGVLQWQVNTGGAVDGTAAAANGVLYVGNNNGDVMAIDYSYGGIIASMTAPIYVVAPITVSDGVVYFTSEYSKTYAYTLKAGLGQVRKPVHAPAVSSLHPDLTLAVTK